MPEIRKNKYNIFISSTGVKFEGQKGMGVIINHFNSLQSFILVIQLLTTRACLTPQCTVNYLCFEALNTLGTHCLINGILTRND